ncbi:MAG: segregation/condensation protein A, partial [Psychrobacter sp.]|nr:segregation/condensation protein A [Psychrobacter sp.]
PSYSPNLLIDSLFKMQLQPDYQMHTIKVDAVPLSDRIASISRQLSTDGAHSFYELLDKTQGKIGVVVSFVAVLELMKRQLVGVINADLKGHGTAADDEFAENSHIGQLTLQWLA